MNTIFNNMVVQAKVQDMLEQAAEARADRRARITESSSRRIGYMLAITTAVILSIVWMFAAG